MIIDSGILSLTFFPQYSTPLIVVDNSSLFQVTATRETNIIGFMHHNNVLVSPKSYQESYFRLPVYR